MKIENETPAQSVAIGLLLVVLMLQVGWLILDAATNAGPNCPAPVDPQWLGYCDDPEAQTR